MRIGAVSTIVGAQDARNAASRLTMPVSDGSCRTRILAGLGRACGQLTPALLGVG
jgi:hypothetical protein